MRPELNSPNRACASYADALVDFSDNELSADERARVASHIAMCPGCRGELARLDASLACLSHGIATVESHAVDARKSSSAGASPSPYWVGAAGIAAVGLICLVTVWRVAQRPIEISQPSNVAVAAAPKLSQHDALRQIALIEQQARLQSSLDLLPAEALSSDEREETQAIVQRLHNAQVGRGDSL